MTVATHIAAADASAVCDAPLSTSTSISHDLAATQPENPDAKCIDADSLQSSPTLHYTFRIDLKGASFSGLLLLHDEGETINGCMINEFGVSALDFSYNKRKRKVKLLRVAKFLDKWYIRMTLKRDIGVCLRTLSDPADLAFKGYSVSRESDSVTIINLKRKISYSFTPLAPKPTKDS